MLQSETRNRQGMAVLPCVNKQVALRQVNTVRIAQLKEKQ